MLQTVMVSVQNQVGHMWPVEEQWYPMQTEEWGSVIVKVGLELEHDDDEYMTYM